VVSCPNETPQYPFARSPSHVAGRSVSQGQGSAAAGDAPGVLSEYGFLPPLGLEYIAAHIAPYAEALDVVDLRKEPGRANDFLRPETDLICFSVNWDRDADFLEDEVRSVPDRIFTMVGGRHATEDPERWLTNCPNVDVVVRGAGEEAVDEFCKGAPLEDIAGISFRRGDRIAHNVVRKTGPIRDTPLPGRCLRRSAYPVIVQGVNIGVSIDLLVGSRGCPFNCKFCSFNRNPWGEKQAWSGRSPESIVEELAGVPALFVAFTDDLFTFDMDRVERICDLILARGIRKKYIVNARLEIARHPRILKKMEKAGFTVLLLGIESAHDKTLRSMQKGFDTAKIREYCDALEHSRMFLHGYFIIGNIGESAEEILQIGPFARELGLDTLGLSALRTSPYSGLDESIAANPDYHISESGKVYSDAISSNELRRLRRRIQRQFYSAGHVLRLLRKGVRNGALALLPVLAPAAPRLLWRAAARRRRHAMRRARRPTASLDDPAA